MFTVRSLHIALEVWVSILCSIIVICLIIGEGFDRSKKRIMISMQACTAFLLIMDAFAWDFRGNAGTFGYYMVRISNFFVFVLSDILVMLYHTYVCNRVYKKENRTKECRTIIASVYLIESIGILLIIISQFNHMYYYFDEFNTYHRGPLHPLSLTIGLAGGIIDMCILAVNRKKLNRTSVAAMLSYSILPALSSVALIFY